ncbi:hypothetical protein HS961_17375 [Comamonas piscis]|uniref:Uncharacterized protein n=1 Tax=Comamonas piscis TaxID=1562974 RepID=A0A7G5EKD6_9BURK|nr:hypothetical protein [Comamonas piscis]QMV74461.1 hypothetical protein HS961_17375 [Comamonas piscis]WSO32915.1 hypothetical protein VUJ63_17430 [Comamonas piscis]
MSSNSKKNPVVPENGAPRPALARKAVQSMDGASPEESVLNYAKLVISPEMASFRVITKNEREELMAQLDTPSLIDALREQSQAIHQGDLKVAEAMLMNQATALQSLFVKLTETGLQASLLRQQETALRLALKAQSQCRATLETLTNIKNPPVVYAKQANVTTGPQQINNGLPAAPTGTQENKFQKNKLKEFPHEQEQWLDAGTPSATGGTHSGAEALAPIHRADKRRG